MQLMKMITMNVHVVLGCCFTITTHRSSIEETLALDTILNKKKRALLGLGSDIGGMISMGNIVTGIVILVRLLLVMAISQSSDGRERTDAYGMCILVSMLLEVAISQSSNGREKMAATGMSRLVRLLLKMAIFSASNSNGRCRGADEYEHLLR